MRYIICRLRHKREMEIRCEADDRAELRSRRIPYMFWEILSSFDNDAPRTDALIFLISSFFKFFTNAPVSSKKKRELFPSEVESENLLEKKKTVYLFEFFIPDTVESIESGIFDSDTTI